jgi:hypothetical protein
MTRVMRIVAFVAAMSTSAAVIPAAMDAPARNPTTGSTVPPATGATEITPAEQPARPANVPGGAGALILPGAILIGIAAAVAGGGGDEPAPFPSGTTGTL